MNIQIVDPANYKEFEALIEKCEQASIFHTPAWAATLAGSYAYKPCYFIAVENKALACCVPVMEIRSRLTGCRGVSLPFSDYAGPVLSESGNYEIVLNRILDYGKEKGWRFIELRGWEDLLCDKPCSSVFRRHVLPLSRDMHVVYSQLHQTTKRKIKRAVAADIQVHVDSSLHAVKAYYDLHCMTRKRQGVPPQPFSFFQNVYRHIISKGKGSVVLASLDNAYIAGSVYFNFNKKAYYKYGAFDMKYHDLSPSCIVMWEAIKMYAQNGYESLCLGRTDPAHKGLLQYKESWGCASKIINYYKHDIKKGIFIDNQNRGKYTYNEFFSALPLSVLKIFGNILYRHIG
jgi:hypothetical protein